MTTQNDRTVEKMRLAVILGCFGEYSGLQGQLCVKNRPKREKSKILKIEKIRKIRKENFFFDHIRMTTQNDRTVEKMRLAVVLGCFGEYSGLQGQLCAFWA